MLRVTRFEQNGATESLRVEGRLTRSELPRFEAACRELLEAGRALRLDLTGLQFIDREAVSVLRGLRGRGVTLVGASGFVGALLADR
jgi:ABC-type transporter Mla MlaB component